MGMARLVASVVSAIALLALAVPPVQAGGAMGIGDDGSSACRAITNGTNPPHVVHWAAEIGDRSGVAIGAAQLLCAFIGAGGANVAQNPSFDQNTVNSFVCYQVSGSDTDKLKVAISDKFVDQTVNLAGYRLMCVPATASPTQ
jgi:hypothetical protein